jgi:hypothetical protein
MEQRKILTDNFLRGILYVFSFGFFPILVRRFPYKREKSNQEGDLERLKKDWDSIGNDIAVSYEKFSK